jgi:hypothetical protein
VALLTSHRQRCVERAAMLGVELAAEAYMFSPAVDGSTHLKPRHADDEPPLNVSERARLREAESMNS